LAAFSPALQGGPGMFPAQAGSQFSLSVKVSLR